MTSSPDILLKSIPNMDTLLEAAETKGLTSHYGRPQLLGILRKTVAEIRTEINTKTRSTPPTSEEIIHRTKNSLIEFNAPNLQPLINGTGIVIHTNLGRSPLADEAAKAMFDVSIGYSNLEFDLENGERGTRYSHVESLVCELTGAEAALVVNNNAAAVILTLSTLATGSEVIVSRGELVEIGGSFRIPDVMRQSGAKLVEVGATNRTHPKDYSNAITSETALLLKVHTSNFAIVGFTSDTSLQEMSIIAKAGNLPVMLDAGSGCLIDLSRYGICGEPTVREYLKNGADIVTFSGDKLLGGPQAGIIAGKRDLIEPMKKHPLLRGVRIDKSTLAALEATLRLYRNEHNALIAIPTLRMLTYSQEALKKRATNILRRLRSVTNKSLTFNKHPGESSAGGGSFPLLQLPTTLIEVMHRTLTCSQLERALRNVSTPVIGRIHRDRFLLDPRTILDTDLHHLISSLSELPDRYEHE